MPFQTHAATAPKAAPKAAQGKKPKTPAAPAPAVEPSQRRGFVCHASKRSAKAKAAKGPSATPPGVFPECHTEFQPPRQDRAASPHSTLSNPHSMRSSVRSSAPSMAASMAASLSPLAAAMHSGCPPSGSPTSVGESAALSAALAAGHATYTHDPYAASPMQDTSSTLDDLEPCQEHSQGELACGYEPYGDYDHAEYTVPPESLEYDHDAPGPLPSLRRRVPRMSVSRAGGCPLVDAIASGAVPVPDSLQAADPAKLASVVVRQRAAPDDHWVSLRPRIVVLPEERAGVMCAALPPTPEVSGDAVVCGDSGEPSPALVSCDPAALSNDSRSLSAASAPSDAANCVFDGDALRGERSPSHGAAGGGPYAQPDAHYGAGFAHDLAQQYHEHRMSTQGPAQPEPFPEYAWEGPHGPAVCDSTAVVEFRCTRRLFQCPGLFAEGDFVIVEGDRGVDVGLVTGVLPIDQETGNVAPPHREAFPIASLPVATGNRTRRSGNRTANAPVSHHSFLKGTREAPREAARGPDATSHFFDARGLPQVLRCATALEVRDAFGSLEQLACEVEEYLGQVGPAALRLMVAQESFAVADVEVQADRERLTVFYTAQSEARFHELSVTLFRRFHCRVVLVWLGHRPVRAARQHAAMVDRYHCWSTGLPLPGLRGDRPAATAHDNNTHVARGVVDAEAEAGPPQYSATMEMRCSMAGGMLDYVESSFG